MKITIADYNMQKPQHICTATYDKFLYSLNGIVDIYDKKILEDDLVSEQIKIMTNGSMYMMGPKAAIRIINCVDQNRSPGLGIEMKINDKQYAFFIHDIVKNQLIMRGSSMDYIRLTIDQKDPLVLFLKLVSVMIAGGNGVRCSLCENPELLTWVELWMGGMFKYILSDGNFYFE